MRWAAPAPRSSWHLHPPMLRALGMKDKLTLGRRARPAIRALRRGKRLRGTRLDPFGRTEIRRLERALPGEYLDAMGAVYERLTADRLDEAVAIAELPIGCAATRTSSCGGSVSTAASSPTG